MKPNSFLRVTYAGNQQTDVAAKLLGLLRQFPELITLVSVPEISQVNATLPTPGGELIAIGRGLRIEVIALVKDSDDTLPTLREFATSLGTLVGGTFTEPIDVDEIDSFRKAVGYLSIAWDDRLVLGIYIPGSAS